MIEKSTAIRDLPSSICSIFFSLPRFASLKIAE